MHRIYKFDQAKIKNDLAKFNCSITIDTVIKVQAFLNEYHLYLIEIIGCGSFGTVFKSYDDYNKRDSAIKIIINQNLEKKKELEDEYKFQRKINSEYVVKIFEHFYDEDSSCFMIVMEYCQYGDLRTYFKNKQSLEKDEIISIFTAFLLGIKDIHKKNIIHAHLKPQNILLVENQKPKICDLGLSKILQRGKSFTVNKGGTFTYQPLEQVNGQVRLESDYYSAGSILCYLCSLDIESNGMMMYHLKNGNFPDINNTKQKELIEIGFQMMKYEPKQRIKPEIAYDKLIKLKTNNNEQKIQQIDPQNQEIDKNNIKNQQYQQKKDTLLNQFQKDLFEIGIGKIDLQLNEIKLNLRLLIINFKF